METDVVVLGLGGAAMTATIAVYDVGAKEVVILEKTGMVGGTTAISGGMLWAAGKSSPDRSRYRPVLWRNWPRRRVTMPGG